MIEDMILMNTNHPFHERRPSLSEDQDSSSSKDKNEITPGKKDDDEGEEE
jgi:hypothetical protein